MTEDFPTPPFPERTLGALVGLSRGLLRNTYKNNVFDLVERHLKAFRQALNLLGRIVVALCSM